MVEPFPICAIRTISQHGDSNHFCISEYILLIRMFTWDKSIRALYIPNYYSNSVVSASFRGSLFSIFMIVPAAASCSIKFRSFLSKTRFTNAISMVVSPPRPAARGYALI